MTCTKAWPCKQTTPAADLAPIHQSHTDMWVLPTQCLLLPSAHTSWQLRNLRPRRINPLLASSATPRAPLNLYAPRAAPTAREHQLLVAFRRDAVLRGRLRLRLGDRLRRRRQIRGGAAAWRSPGMRTPGPSPFVPLDADLAGAGEAGGCEGGRGHERRGGGERRVRLRPRHHRRGRRGSRRRAARRRGGLFVRPMFTVFSRVYWYVE